MCSHQSPDDQSALLQAILGELQQLRVSQALTEQKLESFALTAPLSPPRLPQGGLSPPSFSALPPSVNGNGNDTNGLVNGNGTGPSPAATPFVKAVDEPLSPSLVARGEAVAKGYSQRVILTTYPGQVGINPIPLEWGASTPEARGPVVASRQPKSLKIRNAIGAYAGSYSVYKALTSAAGLMDPNHRPDYTNTEPPFEIPHNPNWDGKHKIVAIDPYGHITQVVHRDLIKSGIDARPTISITKAHLKLHDFDEAVRAGTLEVDGKIVVKTPTDWIKQNREATDTGRTARAEDDAAGVKSSNAPLDAGVELNTSKVAFEPVWYLPGIAERFNVSEGTLRRCLFEETGGMYPELMTRHDLKVFLPPIGGMTAYIFGNPDYLRDESKELTLRIHDECNGSDVFGSDICTCRPYLMYGIEEAVKCAQRGGVGIILYSRKEGRALGEVTKYLVYNARKRSGDNAADYFNRTELIAGVKDMRFQVLMPDALLWLGIKKIDNLISMSDLKYQPIVDSGIKVIRRYELPDELIPPDSAVEIQAKIAAGYFSNTKVTDLTKTAGRLWEDLAH